MRVGIIPAYAGSTRNLNSVLVHFRDHPRIRGEHQGNNRESVNGAGSSPHTRGALLCAPATVTTDGIIPAYAGSTPRASSPGAETGDHPRIRGEHFSYMHASRSALGSSPHTRGAPHVAVEHQAGAGIIPAYAGSTVRALSAQASCWDHPRIRGEHFQAGSGS